MIIRCIGHAEFLLELENGMRIATDPYDASCGYPVEKIAADVALVSHGHHDHNAVENLTGLSRIIDAPGEYDLGDGVRVRAVLAAHDEAGGAKRGSNLLFCLEAEGLRVMHLGDLGHIPTQEQLDALGFYTIDAPTAREVAQLLHARVILPMHYRTSANADWPIDGVERFMHLYQVPAEFVDLLRVSGGDLACQPPLAVLKPASLNAQAHT